MSYNTLYRPRLQKFTAWDTCFSSFHPLSKYSQLFCKKNLCYLQRPETHLTKMTPFCLSGRLTRVNDMTYEFCLSLELIKTDDGCKFSRIHHLYYALVLASVDMRISLHLYSCFQRGYNAPLFSYLSRVMGMRQNRYGDTRRCTSQLSPCKPPPILTKYDQHRGQ